MKNEQNFLILLEDGKLKYIAHGSIEEKKVRVPFSNYEKMNVRKMHSFLIEQIGDYKEMSWTYGPVTQVKKDLHIPVHVHDSAGGKWSKNMEFVCYFNGTLGLLSKYGERPVDAVTKDVRNFWKKLMGWA